MTVGARPAVLIERREAILHVTLNRPEKSNAINPAVLAGLDEAWTHAEQPSYRSILITANGPNFCGGGDLKAGREAPEELDLRRAFNPRLLRLAKLDQPVVAALNGAVAGAGLGLALIADVRVMADTARLVPAWCDIGLVPDFGASWCAARLIGESRTFEWFASGRTIYADEALALGLASRVVPASALLDDAFELAGNLASKPGRAVVMTKQLLSGASRRSLAEQLEREARASARAHHALIPEEGAADRMAAFTKFPGA